MIERERRETEAWTPNRIVALVIGIVFTLIGLAGFLVPFSMANQMCETSHRWSECLAGFLANSTARGNLLGFDVDVVHNLVHLITGLLGLAAAYTGWARRYNQIFGIIYLIIGLAGLIYPGLYFNGRLLGLMYVNALDHVLHLVVGIIATAVGFSSANYPARSTSPVR